MTQQPDQNGQDKGQSKKAESAKKKIRHLVEHAKYAVLLPLVSGTETAAHAIETGDWLGSLYAAATTGMSVMLLIFMVALTERLTRIR